MTSTAERVLAELHRLRWAGAYALAGRLGLDVDVVRQALAELVADGRIEQLADGLYEAALVGQGGT